MNSCFDDLGYVYIAEQVSPEHYEIKNMQVHNEHGISYLEFDAILQTFSEMNRNERQYLRENIEDCIRNDPKIIAQLKDNGWFGEADHPTAFYQNSPLTPERMKLININNTSHKIMNPVFEKDYLKATIQTDSGSQAGINMMNKIIQGLIPGFSCRAMARLHMIGGKPVVIVKRVITYDWVLYPSHARAHSITSPEYKKKLMSYTTESTSDDIIIPLKELLIYAGKKNPSTQIVMESFELDDKDIIGFSKNYDHIILSSGDNVIYTNINPTVKKTVNKYLSRLR